MQGNRSDGVLNQTPSQKGVEAGRKAMGLFGRARIATALFKKAPQESHAPLELTPKPDATAPPTLPGVVHTPGRVGVAVA
jgi:hypothetical protein